MMLKKKKGQSILEYVIVLIAIVACIAWAAITLIAPKDKNSAKAGVGKLIEQTGQTMEAATGEIAKIGQ